MVDEIKTDDSKEEPENLAEKLDKKWCDPKISREGIKFSESPGWGVSSKKNKELEKLPKKKNSEDGGRKI